MQLLSPAQAEEALARLTQHFAQWRQSRRTPRGRIPHELWAQAVALTATLSVTRVAHQLGLTPHALKRRREATNGTTTRLPSTQAPQFVEVAPDNNPMKDDAKAILTELKNSENVTPEKTKPSPRRKP